MSKLVSFDGIFDQIYGSFRGAVEPMDVAVGAIANRVLKPVVQNQMGRIIPASDPAKPSQFVDFLNRPDVKGLLAAGVLAAGAVLVQGGNKASHGHVVGILGIEAVDFAGQKLASMVPPMSGYVEYGMLTQDRAYGMLTRDASYGNWPEASEPTPMGLAALAEDSQVDAANAGEGDREVEYA